MHQPVAIQPGDAYAFDAWILQDDPNVSSAFLRISWYASPDGTGAAVGSVDSLARLDAPAPAYRYLTTGAVAAPSEARSARVRVLLAPKSAARAAIYIDDASFGPTTAAPPPPSGLPANDAISPGVASRESSVLDTSRRPRAAAVPEAPVPGVRVVINEVLYDSIGEGSDADGEWVELYNAGDAPAQLAGWALEDNVGSKVLPGFLLGPGGFAVIAASASLLPGIDSVLPLSGRIGNGLGNDGDRVLLRDPSGALVDALSWGSDTSIFDPAADDVPAGHSLERRRPGVDTNAAGDFVDNESPSPGAPLPPHSSGPARESRTGQPIDIIEAEGDSIQPFVLGVIAASAAALVAAVGWRTFPALKSRLRRGV
ncbi:MAG: lamin tail domain-containing protein [Dehalococcoidia bacterium]